MGDVATQNANASGEEMMRRKYPSAAAGRSALLEKRLSRGVPKFFDSGDYNLAKAANDPKHKNKLSLGYPLAVHNSSTSPGVDKQISPRSSMYTPINPLTPPSTPVDGTSDAAAPGATVAAAAAAAELIEAEAAPLRKARPPSAMDLHHRRISRQPSRLADESDADNDLVEALRDLQPHQEPQKD